MTTRAALLLLVACLTCCDRRNTPTATVVLYSSIDQPYLAPLAQEFEQRTGIHVVLQTDTEATKSVGLAERLRAEKDHPQADVWWSNEPFHTIALAREGVLAKYDSPSAASIPAPYKDAGQTWAGCGLRARVLAVHNDDDASTSLQDLLKARYRGKVAIARPTAGTTAGHIAALSVLWGDERASEFLRKLKENDVKLLGGNGPVAEAVGRGTVLIGLTDNDDVESARREGGSVSAIMPDQRGEGTLMIPTTVGLIAGAPHPDAAKKLIDYLLSSEVEAKLMRANFAGWSVREQGGPTAMKVDYGRVAEMMPQVVRTATNILEGRE